MLIWPVYPNIGIDNRNQYDMARDLPGGLPALRQMVADFHRRGVRVLFPVMPWDTGTRPKARRFGSAAARNMKEIGADGVNGDTMGGFYREYRTASDESGHPVAFEPEGITSADGCWCWNNMSWGYWEFRLHPWSATKMAGAAAHGQRVQPVGAGQYRLSRTPFSTASALRAGRTSGAYGTG